MKNKSSSTLYRRILNKNKPSEAPKQQAVTQHPAVADIKLGAGNSAQKKKNVYKF